MADLEKAIKSGRTPEQEVGLIAEKTPQMDSAPNMFHIHLCLSNLMGYETAMTGQIILAGGKPVKSGNRSGVVFENPAEAEALSRWQDGKFLEVERKFARVWREGLAQLKFDKAIKKLNDLGINPTTCKTLEQAKEIAQSLVVEQRNSKFLQLALKLMGIPMELWNTVLQRWKQKGFLSLSEFAPYAAYVVTADLFFYIAAAARLFSVSGKKVTNRIDLAYLYYLPFCMVSTSSDTFHQRCAPFFLRSDQQFVWGPDLKGALTILNEYYDGFPEAEKEKGLFAIASKPPLTHTSIVTELWDRFCPNWRRSNDSLKSDLMDEKDLIKNLNEFTKAPAISPDQVDFDPSNPDALALHRKIQMKRGKYWLVPKDLETKSSGDKPE